ncbi:hypothetical protein GCM10010435_26450 [Winogradskya consettensis]|uniref:Ricin B lectin domain-containing protein n=1 Tax=Winogradskya consettensis TaxID=113560 RepID=A0A919VLT7_9ACTN|nr:hypothetical protein [Actinoplanes consettensis]GIM68097.1 hypothetical protein Aco04nite_09240 [Actinoplanes consettensis]
MRTIITGAAALALLSACANATPTASAPAASTAPTSPAAAIATEMATAAATPTKAATKAATKTATKTATKAATRAATSDLSQLERLGIDVGEGVLIDVADDGEDRYLQVGRNGVDFTGTSRTDSTMMALKAAPVSAKNRVLIKPPFFNEDLGKGSCVADTKGAALALETCQAGRAAQIWTVVPGGDSGQFELKGAYGIVTVDNGRITTGGSGRTGLQTIPFSS